MKRYIELKDNNMKPLIDLSTYQPIDFNNNFLASCGKGDKKKLAFTLAEVLVTLGVIGVIAAMTIPGLMSNYRKRQLQTQIKADFSYQVLP